MLLLCCFSHIDDAHVEFVTACLSFAVQYPSVYPTIFMGFFTPTDDGLDDLPPEGPTDSSGSSSTTSTDTDGDSHKRLYQGLNDKLIPIYCSILAAVVVGVVAFIIFKRWEF